MQPVSDEFQLAMLDVQRTLKVKVEMDLFQTFNSTPPVGSPTSNGTYLPAGYGTSPFPPSAAFNGLISVDPTVASQVVTNPNYAYPSDGSLGWWSSITTDAYGRLPIEATLSMDYGAAQPISGFAVYGDPILGYPVDFVIYTSNNGTSWTPIIFVGGNTNYIWGQALTANISSRFIRIGITKFSRPNAQPVVIEFSTRFKVTSSNLLKDRVKSVHIIEEAFYDDATSLPVGNYSAASCDITLDNSDGIFYQRNVNSPFYGFLRPNRKITVYFGLYVPDDITADADGYVWLQKGVYYTRGFAGTLAGITTTFTCWNRAKLLSEAPYDGSQVIKGKTLSELIIKVLTDNGLSSTEYNIDQTYDIVDYAYFEPKPIWQQLAELATAETGFLYVDEFNRVTFKDRYFYYSSRLTSGVQPGSLKWPVKYVGALDVGDPFYVMDGDFIDPYTVLSIATNKDGISGIVTTTTQAVRGYSVGAYVTKTFPAVLLDENNALTDLADNWSVERMKNSITVVSNPLVMVTDDTGAIPASGVDLFKREDNNEPLLLQPGESTTLKIDFSNKPVITGDITYPITISVVVYDKNAPPQPPIDPVGGTAWIDPPYINKAWVNSLNMVIPAPYAWGGYLFLKNNDTQPRAFNLISVTGWNLEQKGGIITEVKDQALITEYGEKNYKLDSQYVIRQSHALGLATHLLGTWSDPLSPLTVPLKGRGLIHLQLGDRIIVRTDTEGLTAAANNSHFYIVRQELTFDGTLSGSLDCISAS